MRTISIELMALFLTAGCNSDDKKEEKATSPSPAKQDPIFGNLKTDRLK